MSDDHTQLYPMSTLQSLYPGGNVYVLRHVFERAGYGVRKPAHSDIQHNVMVLCGSVAVDAEGQESKTLQRGDMLKLDDSLNYHIAALEPNTEVLNLLLLGTPESHKSEHEPGEGAQ